MSEKIKLRSEPEEIIQKKKWDRKYLIRTAVWAAVGTVALQAYTRMNLYFDTATNDRQRYLVQLVWLVMAISYLMALLSFRRAIPKVVRTFVFSGMRWVFGKLSSGINKLTDQLRRMLGFNDRAARIRGRDEKSFEYEVNENSLLRKLWGMQNKLRWRDLTENADKIRFLYIKFINRLVSKKHLKYKSVLTPCELGGTLALKPEEGAGMFWLYTGARYSGGIYEITDADVEKAMDIANGKNKAE